MTTAVRPASPPVSGWLSFAGLLILLLGVFNVVEGVFALFNDKYVGYAAGEFYLFDRTGWGWVHIILGVIQIVVGSGIMAGKTWARGVGVGLAALTALIQMLYLPVFPWWSLINIALCVLVIYALIVPPRGAIGS
ncbi:hypothetical protein QEZ54_02070 [Catellatospora sp. KI3]|uniref:DUF7144 family membrane protein n=1 Tax=Catellatospora sp. KI3 TaxID=3041620 RepID=UPI0024822103|nr:hypothetical protein [Catellatospora sp. KI3]MDI1459745.1 hypothetical protein [Catellatospora sp. KI3]